MIDQKTVTVLVLHKDDLAHSDRVTETISLCEKLASIGGIPRHSLTFDGYDDDPREVWEIPECVAFFYRILREVPQFILVVDQQTLAVILYATAVKDGNKWKVNPAWAPVLPNYKEISLDRK